MGGGEKNHPVDFGTMLENEGIGHDLAGLLREAHFSWWLIVSSIPEVHAAIRHQDPADHASHAVSQHDHVLMIRVAGADLVQLLAQFRCTQRIRITRGIAEEPDLVILPDHRISAKALDHGGPGGLGITQSMDAQNGDFFGIIGLQPGQAGFCGKIFRLEQAAEFLFPWFEFRQAQGNRGREICRQGVAPASHGDVLDREWIRRARDALLTFDFHQAGHPVVGMFSHRKFIELGQIEVLGVHYQWCPKSLLRTVIYHEAAFKLIAIDWSDGEV